MNRYVKPLFFGIVPALLVTLPIGSVYAFSLFSGDMSRILGCSFGEIQTAFSLSIFFLGMGAAFGGPLVEKNVGLSALAASVLFPTGLVLTSAGLASGNIWPVYVGYGCVCGIAQGIGYLVPVKTLVMWFPERKGLASAVPIVSFGLGSGLCAFLHGVFFGKVGILGIFWVLAGVYFCMMLLGGLLIRKPVRGSSDGVSSGPGFSSVLSDRFFVCAWLFMFLNISAGLALIGSCTDVFRELGLSGAAVSVLLFLCGLANGGFRLVFAWMSDVLKDRLAVWLAISAVSVFLVSVSVFWPGFLPVAVVAVNATYGGGFSTLPGILADRYGTSRLSSLHGAVLSAWGVAGLAGNFLSASAHSVSGSFLSVRYVLVAVYLALLALVLYMSGPGRRGGEER